MSARQFTIFDDPSPRFLQAPELTGDEPWLNRKPDEPIEWSEIQIEPALAICILALREMPYRDYLKTYHWDGIRRRAMGRYNGQCLCCKNAVDGHHTNYSRKGFERIEDVVALCRACHAKWHETWNLQIKESLR